MNWYGVVALLLGIGFVIWVILAARKESARMGWTGKTE